MVHILDHLVLPDYKLFALEAVAVVVKVKPHSTIMVVELLVVLQLILLIFPLHLLLL